MEDPKEAFIKAKEAEGVPREEAEAQYAELTNAPGKIGQTGTPPPALEPHIPEKLDQEYPWDQCIADQTAAGYTPEQADKICAAIKNRTVTHASQFYGIKDLKKACAFVLKKAESDKLFAYNLEKSIATFKADAKKLKGDAAITAKFCAVCGTELAENKCPNKDCMVFGKIVEASSDKAHDKVAPTAEQLVERSDALIAMKVEEDTRSRIEERRPK